MNDPRQQLDEIRSIMERSTRYPTLSGASGVGAGVAALIGSAALYFYFDYKPTHLQSLPPEGGAQVLMVLGGAVLLVAFVSVWWFSKQKAKASDLPVWSPAAKLLLSQVSIPLLTGGLVLLCFYSQEFYALMAPFSLIFYGLALWVAGRFSFGELNYLGTLQILLGIMGLWALPHSILFWGAGFGVFHIVYGVYIYQKYDKQQT